MTPSNNSSQSNPPADDGWLDSFESINENYFEPPLTEEDKEAQVAAQAIPSAQAKVDYSSIPADIPIVQIEQSASSLTAFLNGQLAALNKGFDDSFNKSQQSAWFGDFNKSVAESAPNEKVMCKPNGFFYLESENPTSALKDYGFDDEHAKELAPHFEMVFIGKTNARKDKNKKAESFGAYVMQLKTPEDGQSHSAEAIAALAEAQAKKTEKIENELKNSPTLADATASAMLSAPKHLADHAQANGGKAPYVGSGDALFLEYEATKNHLSGIDEIQGLFKISALGQPNTPYPYKGYSETLDSYFKGNLKLHEVVTTDPQKMPQAKLEEIITNSLSNTKAPLVKPPGQELADTPSTSVIKDKSKPDHRDTKGNKDPRNNNNNEEDERSQKAQRLGEKTAIAEALILAAIHLVMALIKLLFKLLMAIVRGTPFSDIAANPNKMIDPNKAPVGQADTADAAKQNEDAAAIAKRNAYANLSDADKAMQEGVMANLKEFDAAYKAITPERQEKLLNDVTKNGEIQTDSKTLLKDLKESIDWNTSHKISDKLVCPVPPEMFVNEKHGILMGRGDGAYLPNGDKAVVLQGYDIGGELCYAVASKTGKKEQGDYDVVFHKASDLELYEHAAHNVGDMPGVMIELEKAANAIGSESGKEVTSINLHDRHSGISLDSVSIADLHKHIPIISDRNIFDALQEPLSSDGINALAERHFQHTAQATAILQKLDDKADRSFEDKEPMHLFDSTNINKYEDQTSGNFQPEEGYFSKIGALIRRSDEKEAVNPAPLHSALAASAAAETEPSQATTLASFLKSYASKEVGDTSGAELNLIEAKINLEDKMKSALAAISDSLYKLGVAVKESKEPHEAGFIIARQHEDFKKVVDESPIHRQNLFNAIDDLSLLCTQFEAHATDVGRYTLNKVEQVRDGYEDRPHSQAAALREVGLVSADIDENTLPDKVLLSEVAAFAALGAEIKQLCNDSTSPALSVDAMKSVTENASTAALSTHATKTKELTDILSSKSTTPSAASTKDNTNDNSPSP